MATEIGDTSLALSMTAEAVLRKFPARSDIDHANVVPPSGREIHPGYEVPPPISLAGDTHSKQGWTTHNHSLRCDLYPPGNAGARGSGCN